MCAEALISALAFAISQLLFVHDPFVVVLRFESFLRVKLSLASKDEGAGAKIRFAGSTQWSFANYVEISIYDLRFLQAELSAVPNC
jgi:hypothetical protein